MKNKNGSFFFFFKKCFFHQIAASVFTSVSTAVSGYRAADTLVYGLFNFLFFFSDWTLRIYISKYLHTSFFCSYSFLFLGNLSSQVSAAITSLAANDSTLAGLRDLINAKSFTLKVHTKLNFVLLFCSTNRRQHKQQQRCCQCHYRVHGSRCGFWKKYVQIQSILIRSFFSKPFLTNLNHNHTHTHLKSQLHTHTHTHTHTLSHTHIDNKACCMPTARAWPRRCPVPHARARCSSAATRLRVACPVDCTGCVYIYVCVYVLSTLSLSLSVCVCVYVCVCVCLSAFALISYDSIGRPQRRLNERRFPSVLRHENGVCVCLCVFLSVRVCVCVWMLMWLPIGRRRLEHPVLGHRHWRRARCVRGQVQMGRKWWKEIESVWERVCVCVWEWMTHTHNTHTYTQGATER